MIEVDEGVWGHRSPFVEPNELLRLLENEVTQAIETFEFHTVDRDDAEGNHGYCRVQANIPVSADFFDQFFNGRTGYRAQYSGSVESGEAFNQRAVDIIVAIILRNPDLLTAGVDRDLCEKSLRGVHTKVWFPKEVTSLDYEPHLMLLPESIRVPRWADHWQHKARPRKGLLAPKPENTAVLLNGTFVRPGDWAVWNQKP